MANLINIDAESQANMIGDDSSPTLTLSNSSTGHGLEVRGLVCVSTASIDQANFAAARIATDQGAAAANATVTGLSLTGTSIASGAVLSLTNNSAYVSTSTIKFITGGAGADGVIRVVLPDGTFGNIPVLADAAVTAVAV